MLNFFAWYFLISLIGWVTFPLAFRLFPALADRGFSFTRALGLLVWGYVFWILASLGVIQNDAGGLGLAFLLLVTLTGVLTWRKENRQALLTWIRSRSRTIIIAEVLFFLAFAAWAFVRASNPQIETAGGEKTMETAFINAILRSPTFPPHDPWLSGYAISYYYFGYVMAAMLAKATATLGTVAHNLMTSLVFGLSFVGAYGIVYNLLAAWRGREATRETPGKSHGFSIYALPILGPLFLLFVSNLVGFLYLLYKNGLFWTAQADGSRTSAFWTWLGIDELNSPPHLFNWWWRASRVIQDLDLLKIPHEIIDEFPAFSYILGDLHPHVLAMPFDLLAVAVGLNLFLGGWKGETNLYFYKLPVRPLGLFFSAVILGGLVFLNTWDILLGFALVAGAFVLTQARAEGWSWRRVEDLLAFSLPVGLAAILLYLPFYLGFSSQAGGILPNLVSPTRGAHLWVMFGPFFVVLFPFILYLWRAEKVPSRWKMGFGLAAAFASLLWIVSWGLAFLAYKVQPGFVQVLINSQCSGSIGLCFKLATLQRLSYIGELLTLLCLIGPAAAFLIPSGERKESDSQQSPEDASNPLPFVMLMILVGAVLILAPDFVFLRDLFYSRLNTVFKFYFQAWLVLSLATAFGAGVLLQKFRGGWSWAYWPVFTAVLATSLMFPIMGLPEKTNDFQVPAFEATLQGARAAGDPHALQEALQVWTLDGGRLFQSQYPDDAAAARWLLTAPEGVVAEAAGPDAYSDYGRISVYSGDPAVLGWYWHEYQWRGSMDNLLSPLTNLTCQADFRPNYDPRRMRSDDIACLYQTTNWQEASQVITQYHVRYVVVGTLERRSYRVSETKFKTYLKPVFQSGDVVIYEIPQVDLSNPAE